MESLNYKTVPSAFSPHETAKSALARISLEHQSLFRFLIQRGQGKHLWLIKPEVKDEQDEPN